MAEGSGNPAGEAFRDHYAEIYKFLLRQTRDHHAAEELAQRVFAEAAEALRSSTAPPTLAWLYTAARRRFIDELRRRTTRRAAGETDAVDLDAVDRTDPYGTNVADSLRNALVQLSHEHREVVVLKLILGLSFAEISARVGASEDACKMRFSRALRTVRTLLAQEGLGP